jgi:hypothetical protein
LLRKKNRRASNPRASWRHDKDGITSLASRTTFADARGYFRFTRLGIGQHTVKVDAPGFNIAVLDYEVGAQAHELIVRLQAR